MKKKMIAGIAMVMGMLSVGALSASAADLCGNCADQQAMQQFTQQTAALTTAIKAKDMELREQYSYDSIDTHKVSDLEAELKQLKSNIGAIATKYGVPACSLS